MALVVDTTKRYRNVPDGQNFTFSLSKPFNELTADDLLSAECWVGFNACSVNQISEGAFLGGIPENNPNYCNLWGTDASWWFDQTDWTTVHWSYPANFPEGVYMRNVYVNRELNPGSYTIANTTARLVLEITPDANTNIQKLCMVGNENYLKAEYGSGSFDSQMSDYTYISPAMLIVVNNVAFLVNQNVQRFFVPDNIGFYIDSATAQGYASQLPSFINSNYHKLAFGWTMGATSGSIEDNCVKTGTNSAPVYTYSNVNFNGHIGTFKLSGGGTNYHKRLGFSMADNADDSDFSLIHRAYTGVRFKVNDTWYKPIITGGIVTGYTDDMTVQSEWDSWTKASGHNVPSGGGGGGSGDDAEAETFGWGGNEVGGMARYYLLTSAEMESLADFMSDPLWTIDYRNCIISMFVVPNSGGLFDAVEPTTIKFKLDDNQKVDTGVSALRISGVNPNTSATIEIPRMNDNFLDFEPYSKYLLYIPFCGVIQLPDYVAGKEINVKLYPDVPTCSCTAIVTSEGRKIATVRGNIGSSIPVTSDGSGIKTAAVINSIANGIVGVGEAVMGASTGNVGMVAGGAAQALGSVLSTTVTLGQAFGYSVGSSGDTSFFGAGTRSEYYIAYPKWNNPDTPETNIYGHTFGFVVNKRGKLKDFEGFTVCDNPHVYGFSCTAAEKEEIEMLLRQGIIIHQPSE